MTRGVREVVAQEHPDDIQARLHLGDQLIALRRTRGLSRQGLADLLGCSLDNVALRESKRYANCQLSTYQITAHLLDAELDLEFVGPPGVDDSLSAMYADLAASAADIDQRHAHDRSRVVARMRAARRWQDITHAQIALSMGVSESAVHQIESDRPNPLLATLQRNARAVRGRLVVTLVPAGELRPAEVRQAAAEVVCLAAGGLTAVDVREWLDTNGHPVTQASVRTVLDAVYAGQIHVTQPEVTQ